jgi:uncharacterized protein
MNKLVIAGGSGFLGQVLVKHFQANFKEIVILSRGAARGKGNVRFANWDAQDPGDWIKELDGCDALINLTGKNVNCRYTKKNKAEILNSRLKSTHVLGEAIRKAKSPPKIWLQAASSTIYRDSRDKLMDEETGETGDDFSMNVCKQWEKAFWGESCPGTKKILMRVAIVLGKGGGAFPPLVRLVKFGLGGRQGSGMQMVSWIHEKDFARVTEWLIRNGRENGIYNVCSPEPLANSQFMQSLRKSLGIAFGLSSPEWLLSLGARLIGTETELVLKSRFVNPKNLLIEGFPFRYSKLEDAFSNLIL